MSSATIDTDRFSRILREKSIDVSSRKLLVSRIAGSEQESDLTEPPNCGGYGRIRHFRMRTSDGWPSNPLPIEPACKALQLDSTEEIKAQVFQNASCNWRCWYCYVPFSLLNADTNHGDWLSADQLVELYLSEEERPIVVDLTGGQPDLVPEWVPWMMDALRQRDLSTKVYLWSDDNLSNDYFWRFLSTQQLELITTYQNYGRVACFKGFDAESFSFNTKAAPELFERQFSLMERFLGLGIDMYGYATFTCPSSANAPTRMKTFVDRLQEIHVNLPLRIVPLEIRAFSTVQPRMNYATTEAMQNQSTVIQLWNNELSDRYSTSERLRNITQVSLAP